MKGELSLLLDLTGYQVRSQYMQVSPEKSAITIVALYMTLYIHKSCYVVRHMSEIKVMNLMWLVFFSTK